MRRKGLIADTQLAFDICEAYNVLAHDWGLYDVKARLDRMDFRPAPSVEYYEGLTETGKAIYDHHHTHMQAGRCLIRTECF